jgi:hypothetical protein
MNIANKTILDHRSKPRHRPGPRRRGAQAGCEAGLCGDAQPGATSRHTRDTPEAGRDQCPADPAAAGQVDIVEVLINNAGIALYDDLSDPKVVEQNLTALQSRRAARRVVRRLWAQEAPGGAPEIGYGPPPAVLASPRVQRGAARARESLGVLVSA